MTGDHVVSPGGVTWLEWGLAVLVGAALSLGMWHGLLIDQGLVGGDTWSYFFPQKALLGDALTSGRIPLWHDLTGLGYPLLAESQAGVFYPTNQILYRVLNPAQAYYSGIILHYAFAFVFAWRFARSQSLSVWSALLAAMVFVYGWFPPRISLEWSIIGGVWLPLTLWQTHEFLERSSRWRFAVLASCLAVHLLAGHFTLAFINQLTLIGYAVIQIVMRPPEKRPSWMQTLAVPGAIAVSILLSSIQLLPTMELKLTSQREGVTTAFDPGYGHMPPMYLTQLVASWTFWHTEEIRQSALLERLPRLISSQTNAVEAHFYLGLLPLFFAATCAIPRVLRHVPSVPRRCWMILGLAGIVYATGALIPVTRHLPGFSFFMGPGRYTIVATLAGSILCGLATDRIFRGRIVRPMAIILIAGLTLPDLLAASRPIADAVMVPAIWPHREESWVYSYFQEQPQRTSRLLMDGPNVGNLFGVSCVPQYLGLGPSVYYGESFKLSAKLAADPSPEEIARMQAVGVTHILTTDPVKDPVELRLIKASPDRYLNAVWGRGNQSIYVYELTHPGQRLTASPPGALASWKCDFQTPEEQHFDVSLHAAANVSLLELNYPGWFATVDGQPVATINDDKLNRTVMVPEGSHRLVWKYDPAGFRVGAWLSGISFFVLWTMVVVRRKQRNREIPK